MSMVSRSVVFAASLGVAAPAFAVGVMGSGNFDPGGGPLYGYGYAYGNVPSTNAATETGGVGGSRAWRVTADSTDPVDDEDPNTPPIPPILGFWGFGGGAGVVGAGGPNGIQNQPTADFGVEPDKFFFQFDALLSGFKVGAGPTSNFNLELSFNLPGGQPAGRIELNPFGSYDNALGGFQRFSGSFAGGRYFQGTTAAGLAAVISSVVQIQLNINVPPGDANFGRDADNVFIFDNVIFSQGPIPVVNPVVKGDFGGNESSDGSFNTPDGAFDGLDIEGFLLALNSEAAYLTLNPELGLSLVGRGDFGGNESTDGSFNTPDGAFDGLDIEGFLLALNDPAGYAAIQPPGVGGVSAIPEPAALGLLAPVGLLLARRRR